VAERRSVAADVVGSNPTSRPKFPLTRSRSVARILKSSALPLATAPASGPAASAPPSKLFAGTSGWAYATWKPGFYPEKLPAKKFLEFYASQLTSVEVNYTFRALPTAKMLEGWLAATPENFRFSFKAPQRITHFGRLRECTADLTQFVTALEPVRQVGKLGLLFFQLPPNFKVDTARLDSFLAEPALQGFAVAFEFRHESWFSEDAYAVLSRHNAALCIAESDDLSTPEIHTARTFTCFRLRRNGGYKPAEIKALATRLGELSKTRNVYAYFKHEDEPTGALNATAFLAAAGSL
jgi:uncharacterized protein YecE (DUF72 family)